MQQSLTGVGFTITCRWARCGATFADTYGDRIVRRMHESDHGALFEGPHVESVLEDTPLGPKPWRVDLEGSDSATIQVVAADGSTVVTLMVRGIDPIDPNDDDAQEAAWQATAALAEQIAGARSDALAPRLENELHTARYYAARREIGPGPVDPLTVACPVCGESVGTRCA